MVGMRRSYEQKKLATDVLSDVLLDQGFNMTFKRALA